MLSNSKLSIKITFPATKQSDISKSSPRCSKAKPRSSERGKGHQSYPGPEEPRPPSFRCYFQNRFISSVATRQKRISPGIFSANVRVRAHARSPAPETALSLRCDSGLNTPSLPDASTVRQLSNSPFQPPAKGKVESLLHSWSLSLDLPNPAQCFKNRPCFLFL